MRRQGSGGAGAKGSGPAGRAGRWTVGPRREAGVGLVLVALGISLGAPQGRAQVIGEVRIEGNTRTRTEVIRRELLFSPGDSLDAALIAETERKLRALLFLGDVEIAVVRANGAVDVVVRVRDLYARALSPLLSGRLDELSYGGVALDYNFLGRGQIAQVTVEHDAVEGDRGEALFQEPRLLQSRLAVTARGAIAEEGHVFLARVERPFFSLGARWAYGAEGYGEQRVERLYANQALTEAYRDALRGGSAWVARSFGTSVKARPVLGLAVSDRTFAPEPGSAYAPSDRRRVQPSLGITVWRPLYLTRRFVNHLGRTEDIQSGSWATAQAGVSARALGSDRDYGFLRLHVAPRRAAGDRVLLFGTGSVGFRFDASSASNITGQAEGTAHVRVGEVHGLAVRARWDAVARSEDSTQLLLGSLRGLRGYALRRFDGTRRFLMNAELRPTLLRRPSFVVAAVAFVDVGSAWTPGRTSRTPAVGMGIGGRLGLPRVYNSPVLRADLGYGLRDRAWVLVVGMGQYF